MIASRRGALRLALISYCDCDRFKFPYERFTDPVQAAFRVFDLEQSPKLYWAVHYLDQHVLGVHGAGCPCIECGVHSEDDA